MANVFALRRTTRQDVQAGGLVKEIVDNIPIPPVERGVRLKYPWFRLITRRRQSFHADSIEEVGAFRSYCRVRGWRCVARSEGNGWRVWRIM